MLYMRTPWKVLRMTKMYSKTNSFSHFVHILSSEANRDPFFLILFLPPIMCACEGVKIAIQCLKLIEIN